MLANKTTPRRGQRGAWQWQERVLGIRRAYQTPAPSIPNALYMMGRSDDAIHAVEDVLALGMDLLTHTEFELLHKDMLRDVQTYRENASTC